MNNGKKCARRFNVRMIFKGCHQVSPDDFVTHYVTKEAVVDFGEEVSVNMVNEELEGVEIIAEMSEKEGETK